MFRVFRSPFQRCSMLLMLLSLIGATVRAASDPVATPTVGPGYGITPAVALDGHGGVVATWSYVPGAFDEAAIMYVRGVIDADTITWENPQQVSADNGAAKPRIAIDSRGQVHIVWLGPSGIEYSQDGGAPMLLGAGFTPDLAITADDRLVVTWSDTRDGTGAILFRTKPMDGPWTAERQVATGGVLARNNRVVVAPSGVHLVVEYKPSDSAPFRVGYARGTVDGNFGALRELHTLIGAPAGFDPSLAVDALTGRVAVVWTAERNDGQALVYTESAVGDTWSAPTYYQKSRDEWAFSPALTFAAGTPFVLANVKHWTGSEFDTQTIERAGSWELFGTSPAQFPTIAASGQQVVALWSQDDDTLYSVVTTVTSYRVWLPLVHKQ